MEIWPRKQKRFGRIDKKWDKITNIDLVRFVGIFVIELYFIFEGVYFLLI